MVLVLCILMSAFFIRGITGFGSALISVPLLALSQPLQFAVPLVLALDFTASLVLGGLNQKQANWGEIKILLPFGMIGACVGAYALLTDDLRCPERFERCSVERPSPLPAGGNFAACWLYDRSR